MHRGSRCDGSESGVGWLGCIAPAFPYTLLDGGPTSNGPDLDFTFVAFTMIHGIDPGITGIFSNFEALLRGFEKQIHEAAPVLRRTSRHATTSTNEPEDVNQNLHDGISIILAEFVELRDKALQLASIAGGGCPSATATVITTTNLQVKVPAAPEPQSLQPAKTKTSPAIDSAVQEPQHHASKKEFFLSLDQMEQGAINHLARFAEEPSFRAIVRMETPPFDWNTLKDQIPAKPDHDLLFVRWKRDRIRGASRLYLCEPSAGKWQLPDLSNPSKKPSYTDALIFLEKMANNPPKSPITYYVGPPLSPEYTHLAHAGDQLCNLSKLDGVNTPYWHLGKSGSGTAFHCEDAGFRSTNFVVGPGWKLWLIIHDSDSAKFEAFVGRRWGAGSCGQWVRHLSLYIAPRMLDKEDIGYDIIVAGQGDMVVTKPRQYHCVVNYSDCLAMSTNLLFPGEPALPAEVVVCNKCGLFPIEHPSFKRVSSSRVPLPPRADSAGDQASADDDLRTTSTRKRNTLGGSQPASQRSKRSRRSGPGATDLQESQANTTISMQLKNMAESLRKLDILQHSQFLMRTAAEVPHSPALLYHTEEDHLSSG